MWPEIRGMGWQERYRVGQVVKGKVEKREKFGLFISLEPGITALLPKSKFKESAASGEIDKLRPGDLVAVVIEQINTGEQKISVGPGDKENVDDWRSFTPDKGASMSSLGEKLNQALHKKNKKRK